MNSIGNNPNGAASLKAGKKIHREILSMHFSRKLKKPYFEISGGCLDARSIGSMMMYIAQHGRQQLIRMTAAEN